MSSSLFTVWHEDAPLSAMLEVLGSFDRLIYEGEVQAHGLEAVAREEWENMCQPRSGWATTFAEAEEHTGSLAGRHVVEVTPETLEAALAEWLGLDGESGAGRREGGSDMQLVTSEVQRSEVRPRQASCDGCGATEAVQYMPWRGETLCPKCSRMYATTNEAVASLADLLGEIVPGWVEHWTAAGAERGMLADILKEISNSMKHVSDPNGGWARFETICSHTLGEENTAQ